MSNRIVNLGKAFLPNPPALTGTAYHKPAKALHVDQMLRAQDNTLTPGRRVLIAEGMRGNPRNQVADFDVLDGDDVILSPSTSFERTIRVADAVPITPGHVLRFEARCLSSGPTGTNSGGSLAYTGDTGRVKLVAVWDDGTVTETVTSWLQFDAPTTDYGHGADLHGSGFVELSERSTLNFPSTMLFDTDDIVTWTQSGVTVDLTLSLVGGTRLVDVCVFEQPYQLGRTETQSAVVPAHFYQAYGNIIPQFPFQYAVEGHASADPRFGSGYALDVAAAAQTQIGPALVDTGCHTGAIRNTGDPTPYSVTSTTFAPLGYTAAVGGGDESPSFDISAGSFGRRHQTSSVAHALTNGGVIRVRVSVYWKVDSGEARMRFRTADWSYVDVSTTSSSYEWTHAIAHLDCGQTVLDRQQIDVLAEVDSTKTGSVQYVRVTHMPD